MIEEISQNAKIVIKNYSMLNVYDKYLPVPYFMNTKKQKGGLRVMVGKGTSEEIKRELKVWAQVKGFDIKKADAKQIRDFMMKINLGVDCSGFVVHVINAELKSKNKRAIWNHIDYPNNSIIAKMRRFFRPVENTSANTLTSEKNCLKVTQFNQIKPSDLIRAKGKQKNAHHVAIINKVSRDEDGNLKWFEYANAHREYEDENGVRIGKVTITDDDKELKEQKWEDNYKGKNYFLEDLLVKYEDNGIRRLKILA